ncbi:NADH:flavin oxidoreductase/NADH oxidase [Pelomicrobium methylotrophicum]|uniref:NADH:flavin oxidoreductase/NADH oxidase n=1 Tax=Pelomicrobium methylotrophicum TaxID=2602750 RepID=A0A5C7EIR0_9PROT|nr:NADH:flavin oxidoreductase/NADH oxidase [Pelomicrobium methylotrophicum]TXF10799.1 NADH:flavin oxidoreductase/NADH oxidase [Pelomicrobium methylotrophicum]
MSSHLFQPIRLRGLTLDNRIMVSPMCQYSAVDGCATDWHLMHLGQFAVSGAGLVMVEMTDVEPRGRITPYCLGLYSDANEQALKRVVDFCKRHGHARIGIQLAHAGRKASTLPPWEGRRLLRPEEGGWEPVAPSAVASGAGAAVPRALTLDEIGQIRDAFVSATQRAARIGFDAIELHCAHGYLLHQFLSPLSNHRTDRYGGSLENRMRFPLEVFAAMRAAWPEDKPLGVRVSATDWAEGGWSLPDTLAFARALKALGCDWIDVSSGGLVKNQVIETYPGYQVPFAEAVRQATGLTTIAIGMITEPRHAEAIVAHGQADMVALARGMLYDPRWAWHAAAELGATVYYPNQYLRCRPWVRHDTFAEREAARAEEFHLPAVFKQPE